LGGGGEVKSGVGIGERLDGVYVVAGPAAFELESGDVEVLGYSVGPGERIVVPEARRIPLRARGAKLHWMGGTLQEGSRELYDRMEEAAKSISALSGKVVLIGPTDSGKSTLASWAANLASPSPRVLSVDVGQNEYYAPAFEALAETPRPPLIPGLPTSTTLACFAGAYTPSKALPRYIACASKLARRSGEPLFVDTDGWIGDPQAIAVKASLVEALDADYIVTLSTPRELGERLAAATNARHALHLGDLGVSRKSREERRAHRERLLAARLLNSKYRILDASSIPLINSPIFNCRQPGPTGPGIVYSEKCNTYSVLVLRKQARGLAGQRVQVLADGWERGRLAAIVSPDANHHIAIIVKIDYRRRGVHVRSPYEGDVKALLIGEAQAHTLLDLWGARS